MNDDYEDIEPKRYPPQKGRPTKYLPEYNRIAGNLSLAGFSDIEIAEALGIGEQTLYDWQDRYPEFKREMLNGKKIAVGVVARSLFERAQGYNFVETKTEKDEAGNVIKTTETEKFIPPSDSSMSLFLKSKAPEQFTDRKKIEMEHTPRTLDDFYDISHDDPMEVSKRYVELMRG